MARVSKIKCLEVYCILMESNKEQNKWNNGHLKTLPGDSPGEPSVYSE